MAKKKATKKKATKKVSKPLFLVLVEATGVDLSLFTDEQDVLTDITTRIDAFSDDVWKKLPKAAQEWYNKAAAAVEDGSFIALPDGIADWLKTVPQPSDEDGDDEPDSDDEDEDIGEDDEDIDERDDDAGSDADEESDEPTAAAAAEDEPKKKRGATVRFRELMIEHPTWTKAEVIAEVENEGYVNAGSTAGAIWYHTNAVLKLLEAAGRLKPADATPAEPKKKSGKKSGKKSK